MNERHVKVCAGSRRILLLLLFLLSALFTAHGAAAQTTIAKTSRPAPSPGVTHNDSRGEVGNSGLRPSLSLQEADGGPVAAGVSATGAALRQVDGRTLFELTLSGPVAVTAFTLANPDRVVLDLPDVEFRLPDGTGRDALGLVRAFRYGQLGNGRSRIVIDMVRPVKVVRSEMVRRGQAFQLVAELAAAGGQSQWETAAQPSQLGAVPVPPHARATAGKFLVVIDPGHGGADAGAVNALTGVIEKDIVLAVGKQLKAALEARAGYDVRMTRTGDSFISLDRRVQMSEAAGAQLFISLHADSVGDPVLAQSAHGATLYTLSDQASSEAARAAAEKENAADGTSASAATEDDVVQVNAILTDLAKRQTQSFSTEFQRLLMERMRPERLLARDPLRSASFKVLRQSQVPTVLVELGFVSNQGDASQMQLADWQKRVASTIANAIEAYSAKHGR